MNIESKKLLKRVHVKFAIKSFLLLEDSKNKFKGDIPIFL